MVILVKENDGNGNVIFLVGLDLLDKYKIGVNNVYDI